VKTRAYYADTDAGGVVYYANYLRWLEMARYEYLEQFGVPLTEYVRQGYIFAVARLEIDYLTPTRLGDQVEIETQVERVRRVRFILRQKIKRCADDQDLAKAMLTLACLTPEGKLSALPDDLADALQRLVPKA
jgi:tol-pal system-associated acyl-CoA thioesterase